MNAIKQSIYTLLIGLMFLIGVWLFLIQYAEEANTERILDYRMHQARESMKEVGFRK